jgi:Flp pilus assembly protein TadG
MRNKAHFTRSQQGQAMIIVAAVMIGLIALLGLAIDGGNLFMQRRRAQNAADAATLAGTRLLAEAIKTCNADPGGTDLVIAKQVNRFAETNGVPDTNGVAGDEVNGNVTAFYVDKNRAVLGAVGGGTVPTGSTGISADVKKDHETYFLQVVGIPKAGASAHALAMTGPIRSFQAGGSIMPFAVHKSVVTQAEAEGGDFRALDLADEQGGPFCFGDPPYDLATDCTDPDADGTFSAQRGWLNLNYIFNNDYRDMTNPFWNRAFQQNVSTRGCGKDPNRSTDDGLKGWATYPDPDNGVDGCPYPYPIFAGPEGTLVGDFIHGGPGVADSARQSLESFEEHIGYAPIFDYIFTIDQAKDNFGETGPVEPDEEGANLGGDHWPSAGGGGSAYLYHVIGFVGIDVPKNGVGKDKGVPYLDGTFVDVIWGQGDILPDTGFVPGGCSTAWIYAVSLWE